MINLGDILVVVILFNKNPIKNLRIEFPKGIEIIAYDNSPVSSNITQSKAIEYIHDSRNLGVAEGYNYALNRARLRGKKYLLLLDQDSSITNEYFSSLKQLNVSNNISCILPIVKDEITGKIISPIELDPLGFSKKDSILKSNSRKRISAINSGALFSVDFLNNINGFNNSYPLDYLDHWIFRESFKSQYQIVVFDYILYHNLSILHFDSSYPLERFESILRAEKKFFEEETFLYKLGYRIRLYARIIRLIVNGHFDHLKITIKIL